MIYMEQNYIVLRTVVQRNTFYVIYTGADVMFNSVLLVIKYVTIAILVVCIGKQNGRGKHF